MGAAVCGLWRAFCPGALGPWTSSPVIHLSGQWRRPRCREDPGIPRYLNLSVCLNLCHHFPHHNKLFLSQISHCAELAFLTPSGVTYGSKVPNSPLGAIIPHIFPRRFLARVLNFDFRASLSYVLHHPRFSQQRDHHSLPGKTLAGSSAY